MTKFEIAEVLFWLDRLPSELMPDAATAALTEGLDSPKLRELAGLSNPTLSDAKPLFESALQQLGRQEIERLEAVRRYTKYISHQIVSNDIDPIIGAKEIWSISLLLDEEFHDNDPFIYAVSEHEERPNDRKFFVSAIIDEAKRRI